MFTGPVGPVEIFVYWPEAVLGNFYWPGAIGSPLVSSPEYHLTHQLFFVEIQQWKDSLEPEKYIPLIRNPIGTACNLYGICALSYAL